MKILDWKMRYFVRGNFHAFGLWHGLTANLTLMSPLLNVLINWKHRNQELRIPKGDYEVIEAKDNESS